MKKYIVSLGLSLIFSTASFSQKKEIKSAEKAMQKGNYTEAIDALKEAQALNVLDLNDRWKIRYYNQLGFAYRGADEGVGQSQENLVKSGEYFKEALKIDEKNEDAKNGLFTVRNAILDAAIEDQKNQNFKTAAAKLFDSYQLDRNDTIHLYYAAGNAVNGQDYDTALKYYKQLIQMGYDGSSVQYFAKNKENGEIESFGEDKDFRDLSVKSGQYTEPEDKVTESKRGEIAKNISLIYIQTDQADKAIESIDLAKKENPGDVALLQAEADLYYQLGDFDTYTKLMSDIVKLDPENPVLYFNLGVTAEQLGDNESAKSYYEQALELDPKMVNAYLTLASLILQQEQPLIDEMNSLGMSAADNKRYKELEAQRKKYYEEALPYLEEASKIDETNLGVLRTMMNIYYQTGEDDKAEEYKKKIDKLTK